VVCAIGDERWEIAEEEVGKGSTIVTQVGFLE
jgi:hypothetical protein